MKIAKIDHTDSASAEALVDFLAPHEAHALFILGNLKNNFPGSHLYVAKDADRITGVAGYYEGPRSLIPFSRDEAAIRKLVRHVAERHPDIHYMNGISAVAKPAYNELLKRGFQPGNDPYQVFMELDEEPPPQPHEKHARLMKEDDATSVARLLRALRGDTQQGPLTKGELDNARMNPLRHVLVVDGKIVSTAATNGLGIRAFQIIGVATDAEYRKRGYARAVCASLIRDMWKRGANHCVLFTQVENVAAQNCYAGLGFRATNSYYVARLIPPAP